MSVGSEEDHWFVDERVVASSGLAGNEFPRVTPWQRCERLDEPLSNGMGHDEEVPGSSGSVLVSFNIDSLTIGVTGLSMHLFL
jgi:hypothetical protein